jgi:hypothetical protein
MERFQKGDPGAKRGELAGIRTQDPRLKRALLYQLSYELAIRPLSQNYHKVTRPPCSFRGGELGKRTDELDSFHSSLQVCGKSQQRTLQSYREIIFSSVTRTADTMVPMGRRKSDYEWAISTRIA